MPLFRIIYFSENHLEFEIGKIGEQLQSILETSRLNNARDSVTGALIFDDLWFVQALEGDREIVWQTFDRIRADNRHLRLTIVDARQIEARDFSSWSMALIRRNSDAAPVLNEFSSGGRMNVETMGVDDFLSALQRSVQTLRQRQSEPYVSR